MIRRCLCILLSVTSIPAAFALEDPTRPHVKQAVVRPGVQRAMPQLKSILMSPQRRIAVIDDRVLVEGEHTASFELVRIEPRAVVVRLGGGELITLSMASDKIQKESK